MRGFSALEQGMYEPLMIYTPRSATMRERERIDLHRNRMHYLRSESDTYIDCEM